MSRHQPSDRDLRTAVVTIVDTINRTATRRPDLREQLAERLLRIVADLRQRPVLRCEEQRP
jgi:hypothetical protein